MIDRNGAIKQLGLDDRKPDPFEAISKQCQAEYNLAWLHQKSKKDEWEVRLKLYNNQKRDKKDVGDTTLFTVFQTILASLYVDRLDSEWHGREQGDEEVGENLTDMAAIDYEDMGKNQSDYDWIFDSNFFGRGLLDFHEFIREPENKIYLPVPTVIDPIVNLRDPRATSIHGNRLGYGAARFMGWEQKMTKQVMEDHPFIFDGIKFEEIHFGSGTKSILQDAITARAEAQGLSDQKQLEEANLGANAEYDITKWHTHVNINGKSKKVIVYLSNDRARVVGLEVLKKNYFSIIDRPLYPTSHDWDGTSIPDLIEDKQRARALVQNLGFKAAKADIYPMYIYDSNKITNRKDLSFNFNKFIPVNGKDGGITDALIPMTKAHPNMALLQFIYNTLDISAQKATATPEIQQGMMSQEKRTLGEVNIIASKVDTRYSLAAKVFGWSEKTFWQFWYKLYKDNFQEGIDEKVLRIEGAFGAKWRPLKRDNIIATIDPDVFIESRLLSRAKQLEERESLTQFFTLAFTDPTSNRRWGLKKLGKLHSLKKDEIERLFPPTIDERIAEQQNDLLNKNKLAEVLAEDDHNVHLEIHAKANDTPAARVHIETHIKALSIKKVKPELFPADQLNTAFQPPGTSKTPVVTPGGAQPAISPSQTINAPIAL